MMSTDQLRYVLARRVDALTSARPDLDTQTKIAKRAKIGQTTVGRILRCEQSATVDMLEKIADAIGVGAWELLMAEAPASPAMLRVPPVLSVEQASSIQSYIDFICSAAYKDRKVAGGSSGLYSRHTREAESPGGTDAAAYRAPSGSTMTELESEQPAPRSRTGRPRHKV